MAAVTFSVPFRMAAQGFQKKEASSHTAKLGAGDFFGEVRQGSMNTRPPSPFLRGRERLPRR